MFIHHAWFDMFKLDVDYYVIPVNTVGVMGATLAKAFAQRYPELRNKYRSDCRNRILTVGTLCVYEQGGKRFVMFPTKEHWKDNSQYAWIYEGLDSLVNLLPEAASIAIPPLGCGLGGLNYNYVYWAIVNAFKDTTITVHLKTPKNNKTYIT